VVLKHFCKRYKRLKKPEKRKRRKENKKGKRASGAVSAQLQKRSTAHPAKSPNRYPPSLFSLTARWDLLVIPLLQLFPLLSVTGNAGDYTPLKSS
jgi:hypothetical protein